MTTSNSINVKPLAVLKPEVRFVFIENPPVEWHRAGSLPISPVPQFVSFVKAENGSRRHKHGWLMTGPNSLSCRSIPILAGQSCGFAQVWAAEHRRPTGLGFHEPAVRRKGANELLSTAMRKAALEPCLTATGIEPLAWPKAALPPAPYTHFDRSPCSAVGATSL
jgi:hypothetical protein